MKRILIVTGLLAAAWTSNAAMLPRKEILSGADGRIEQYRTTERTLKIIGIDGAVVPEGTEVAVEQVNHKFLFGCNIFMFDRCNSAKDNKLYNQRFQDLFNYATLGFYWASYEPQQGQTMRNRWLDVAAWCKENHIKTKGHPLFWTIEPQWVSKLDQQAQQKLLFGRIQREIRDFRGDIEIWDVLNEPCVGIKQGNERNAVAAVAAYEKLGTIETIRQVFQVARQADPEATLILNDYIVTQEYEDIVRESLAAGASIDVIGIQSHMHRGVWRAEKVWDVCERFDWYQKPLHFSEVTIVSGPGSEGNWQPTTPAGEQQQAKDVVEFYTILFSHPAVEAITWWDLSDQGAWQKAPAGLIREDMSPKPAYNELHKLIKEKWWTKTIIKTDKDGKITLHGFLGEYQAKVKKEDITFQGKFTLSKGKEDLTIRLK